MDKEHVMQKCTVEDAEQLSQISELTFRQAFAAQNTPENMDDYVDKAFHVAQLQNELKHPHAQFFCMRAQDRMIAYLKINVESAQTEFQSSDALEIERVYVLATHQGQGLGKVLMDKAFQIARQQERTYVWLGVWDRNPKAIAFYKHLGFEVVDQHVFVLGDENQIDLIMQKQVD
ncbi:MAG: GNAT family N-acetyltransferase [Bdellovibrionota bacterium]